LLLKKLSLGLLGACSVAFLSSVALAQSPESGSRQTSATVKSEGVDILETDVSLPPAVEERRPRALGITLNANGAFDQLLLTAIQSRLGSHYHYGSTGPNTFDCSGFIWSIFQEAGRGFTRGPARSYWATMPAATKEEQTKFGTLVFFSGLSHVGIVADANGFYHASRHHGVIYSKFDDYWTSRIDGFRRVPTTELKSPVAKTEKTPTSKDSDRGAATTTDYNLRNH
jgi:cell wall-associated NlpC family hydrolase